MYLKSLYSSKKYANVKIKITEERVQNLCSDQVPDTGPNYSTIDAHAVILDMNSSYFAKQLVDHQQGPSEIEITLKEGQVKYMEIMIHAFYDAEVLNKLNESELLSVLQLANTYANDEFVKKVLKLLEEMEVDFDSHNAVLTKIWTLEQDGNHINADITVKLKSRYITYLAKLFSSIEEKYNEHEKFMKMEYASLLYLLESDEILSISENSLLTFIILWLEHDSSRQTGCIIGGLLGSIRMKFISFDFLSSTIKIDNVILNKWDGFHDWFVRNLSALGMSVSLRRIKHPTFDDKSSRNTEFGIHGWYKNVANTYLNACRWSVRMTPEKPGEKFGPTKHLLVHDGFQFSPTLISITPIAGDESTFNINLSISCTGSLVDVRFVAGILPADRDYNIAWNKYFGSPFAQEFLKWSSPLTFNSDVNIIEFWTCSQDFVDHVNEHGMYVLLLPFTDDEYQKVASLRFYCKKGHKGYQPIDGKCYCSNYGTSQNSKIHLTKSCNYSL